MVDDDNDMKSLDAFRRLVKRAVEGARDVYRKHVEEESIVSARSSVGGDKVGFSSEPRAHASNLNPIAVSLGQYSYVAEQSKDKKAAKTSATGAALVQSKTAFKTAASTLAKSVSSTVTPRSRVGSDAEVEREQLLQLESRRKDLAAASNDAGLKRNRRDYYREPRDQDEEDDLEDARFDSVKRPKSTHTVPSLLGEEDAGATESSIMESLVYSEARLLQMRKADVDAKQKRFEEEMHHKDKLATAQIDAAKIQAQAQREIISIQMQTFATAIDKIAGFGEAFLRSQVTRNEFETERAKADALKYELEALKLKLQFAERDKQEKIV